MLWELVWNKIVRTLKWMNWHIDDKTLVTLIAFNPFKHSDWWLFYLSEGNSHMVMVYQNVPKILSCKTQWAITYTRLALNLSIQILVSKWYITSNLLYMAVKSRRTHQFTSCCQMSKVIWWKITSCGPNVSERFVLCLVCERKQIGNAGLQRPIQNKLEYLKTHMS